MATFLNELFKSSTWSLVSSKKAVTSLSSVSPLKRRTVLNSQEAIPDSLFSNPSAIQSTSTLDYGGFELDEKLLTQISASKNFDEDSLLAALDPSAPIPSEERINELAYMLKDKLDIPESALSRLTTERKWTLLLSHRCYSNKSVASEDLTVLIGTLWQPSKSVNKRLSGKALSRCRMLMKAKPIPWIRAFREQGGLQAIASGLHFTSSKDALYALKPSKREDMYLELIGILRAFMNNTYGLESMVQDGSDILTALFEMFLQSDPAPTLLHNAFEIVMALTSYSTLGHHQVLRAMDAAVSNTNGLRFLILNHVFEQLLSKYIQDSASESELEDEALLRALETGLLFINTLLNVIPDSQYIFRIHVRNQLFVAGLRPTLRSLKALPACKPLTSLFEAQMRRDAELLSADYSAQATSGLMLLSQDPIKVLSGLSASVEDDQVSKGFLLEILSLLKFVRPDASVRGHYFKLIKCTLEQWILEGRGIDPDFFRQDSSIPLDVSKLLKSIQMESCTERGLRLAGELEKTSREALALVEQRRECQTEEDLAHSRLLLLAKEQVSSNPVETVCAKCAASSTTPLAVSESPVEMIPVGADSETISVQAHSLPQPSITDIEMKEPVMSEQKSSKSHVPVSGCAPPPAPPPPMILNHTLAPPPPPVKVANTVELTPPPPPMKTRGSNAPVAPPPPPPMIRGKGATSALPSPSSPWPKCKTVAWDNLPAFKISEASIWSAPSSASTLGGDLALLMQQEFQITQTKEAVIKLDSPAAPKVSQKLTFLSPEQSRKIGITMRRFKITKEKLLSALHYGNVIQEEEILEQLLKSIGTLNPSTLSKIHQHVNMVTKDGSKLDLDARLSELSEEDALIAELQHNYPSYAALLDTLYFQATVNSTCDLISSQLALVTSNLKLLKSNSRLTRLFKYLLDIGNTLNAGTFRGSSLGFRISSLPLLLDFKSNSKESILSILIRWLQKNDSDVLLLPSDFPSLLQAAAWDQVDFENDLKQVQSQLARLDTLIQQPDLGKRITYLPSLVSLSSRVHERHSILLACQTDLKDLLKSVLCFYCEDPSSTPYESPKDFLEIFASLLITFSKTIEAHSLASAPSRRKLSFHNDAKNPMLSSLPANQKGVLDLLVSSLKSHPSFAKAAASEESHDMI